MVVQHYNKTEDRVEAAEYHMGATESRVQHIEEENARLKDSLVYLQSQSMRNNLIFGNIPETQFEKTEETELKLRT